MRKLGCFPLCQRFQKFRFEFKWKSPFRFLPTGIFGITSEGGPLISVGIFRSKFVVPFLTNRFCALIREFGRETKSGKCHFYWLVLFNGKMSFHFPREFPLISDRSVWHNASTLSFYTFPRDVRSHHVYTKIVSCKSESSTRTVCKYVIHPTILR